MLVEEEGLANVFARHQRYAEATRRAVRHWGEAGAMEILCQEESEHSGALTAILLTQGHDADALRKVILENFDMSLGQGLGKVTGKIFRIGHLGDFNDLTLMGSLSGVEMGFEVAGVPYKKGGAQAAMDYLADCAKANSASAAKGAAAPALRAA